jgi:glutathione S-transferase
VRDICLSYKKKSLPTYPKKSYESWHDVAMFAASPDLIPHYGQRFTVTDYQAPNTPLSVLLTLMREKWLAGDKDGAADLARAAAPYMHPRIATNARQTEKILEVHLLSDAELTRQLDILAERERSAPENQALPG